MEDSYLHLGVNLLPIVTIWLKKQQKKTAKIKKNSKNQQKEKCDQKSDKAICETLCMPNISAVHWVFVQGNKAADGAWLWLGDDEMWHVVKQFMLAIGNLLSTAFFLTACSTCPPSLQLRIVRSPDVHSASNSLGVAGAEIRETRDWGRAHRAGSWNLAT